jgi:signal peptidase I
MSPDAGRHHAREQSISETIQSLVVAFVLAMAFRGFVIEGFIIPTGSMAPTLMGQHTLWKSPQTGYEFRVDNGDVARARIGAGNRTGNPIHDPMMGPRADELEMLTVAEAQRLSRMGDRILIVKAMYPFFEPQRWDVVVFKNPQDPTGPAQNYIKRLVGLPDEKIWFCDGDVFAGPADAPGLDGYRVCRKPEYIQRAVWQHVYHSNYIPVGHDPSGLFREVTSPWYGDDWQTEATRIYRCETAGPTVLRWDSSRRPIDDDTSYNMLGTQEWRFPVSDVRIAAEITPDAEGLSTTFELEARGQVFQFILAGTQATVRMRAEEDEDGWALSQSAACPPFQPGRATFVEFWHVDQSMVLFVGGERIVSLDYEWSPRERLERATGMPLSGAAVAVLNPATYREPSVRWLFEGSPVSLANVRLDRDLFYQPMKLRPPQGRRVTKPGYEDIVREGTPGFGTHPDKPSVLGPDHFLMCGDNSPASHDSRAWGKPDALVAHQIDDHPFVVHRKLVLGKAWVVYFPAPFALSDGGIPFIPDFGRLRFIR